MHFSLSDYSISNSPIVHPSLQGGLVTWKTIKFLLARLISFFYFCVVVYHHTSWLFLNHSLRTSTFRFHVNSLTSLLPIIRRGCLFLAGFTFPSCTSIKSNIPRLFVSAPFKAFLQLQNGLQIPSLQHHCPLTVSLPPLYIYFTSILSKRPTRDFEAGQTSQHSFTILLLFINLTLQSFDILQFPIN